MHELHTLWFGYCVPSLWGNGPEALIELVIVSILGALLVPPVRRWIVARFHAVHEKIDLRHDELHAKIDANHAEHQASMTALHLKIDAAQPKVVLRARTPNFSDQIAEAMKSSKKKVVKKTVKKAPKKTAAKKTAKKAAKKTAPRKRAATKK
jgi:hypothetical protein